MRAIWFCLLATGCGDNNNNNGGTTGGMAGTGKGVFPSSAPWYTDVSGASLDGKSADVISGLAAAGGWGNGNTMQIDFSIEVLSADANVPRRDFTQTVDFYDPDCDPAPVPVPPGGRLEG